MGAIAAEAVEKPTLCECGCGQPVNAYVDRIRALREQRLTFRQIGDVLGIEAKYAQMLSRFPPRFVKGHSQWVRPWRTEVCKACGQEFRTSAAGTAEYCHRGSCPAHRIEVVRGQIVMPAARARVKRLDSVRKERRAAARLVVRQERRLWTLQEHREARIQERERVRIEREMRKQQERRARLIHREVRRLLRRGEALPWHIQAPKGRLLSVEERLELDEILADQAREIGREGRGWGERRPGSLSPSGTLSLDAVIAGDSYSLADSLTDLRDFTGAGELEHLMITNGVRLAKRGVIVTTGERVEELAA